MVRVFDPKLRLLPEKLKKILEKADLESIGFMKTVETSVETDENGEKRIKETTRYMATDKCSMAPTWEQRLKERLPENFFSPKLATTFLREIAARSLGRSTKHCKVGLEIHFKPCVRASGQVEKEVLTRKMKYKRSVQFVRSSVLKKSGDCTGTCACCNVCNAAFISY